MNIQSLYLALLLAGGACLTGCETEATHAPANTTGFNPETAANFALMDAQVQYSVAAAGLEPGRTPDGRLEVGANLLNRETRRLEVQVQCVFKDVEGFEIESTPWKSLILTENGHETVRFASMNNKAVNYTIRVRQAH